MKPARGARSATRPDAARARFQHLRPSPPVRCPLFRRLLGEKSSQVPPAQRRTSGGNKAEFTVDAATCWGRLTGMRAAAACWPGCYSRALCFAPSLCRSVHVCAAEEFLSGRGPAATTLLSPFASVSGEDSCIDGRNCPGINRPVILPCCVPCCGSRAPFRFYGGQSQGRNGLPRSAWRAVEREREQLLTNVCAQALPSH